MQLLVQKQREHRNFMTRLNGLVVVNHMDIVDADASAASNAKIVDMSEEEIKRIFDRFDVDGSGGIDKSEARNLMDEVYGEKLGESLTEQFMEHDADGNGEIDYEEFKDFVARKTAERQKAQHEQKEGKLSAISVDTSIAPPTTPRTKSRVWSWEEQQLPALDVCPSSDLSWLATSQQRLLIVLYSQLPEGGRAAVGQAEVVLSPAFAAHFTKQQEFGDLSSSKLSSKFSAPVIRNVSLNHFIHICF
jgi:hypothetical protein